MRVRHTLGSSLVQWPPATWGCTGSRELEWSEIQHSAVQPSRLQVSSLGSPLGLAAATLEHRGHFHSVLHWAVLSHINGPVFLLSAFLFLFLLEEGN